MLSAHERSLAGTLGRIDANEGAVDAADHSGNGAMPKEAFFHGRLFFDRRREAHPPISRAHFHYCLGNVFNAIAHSRLRHVNHLLDSNGTLEALGRKETQRTHLLFH